jgi:peptide/nickel transport system permease protein
VISIVALTVGTTLGLIAGYRGGRVDSVIMRWVDLMYALPALLVAIVLVGIFGASYPLAVALLCLFTAPYDTRLVRGATLEQRSRAYVEAARALGLPTWRILAFQIWPNVLPVEIANAFLNFAISLVALSGLSYLGLGVGPGTPDWGLMLAENRTLLFQTPIAALVPAAMIILTATAMNLIGDYAHESLADRGRAR